MCSESEAAETDQLVIIHTQDQEYALGAVTQPRQPTSNGVPGQSGSLYSSIY